MAIVIQKLDDLITMPSSCVFGCKNRTGLKNPLIDHNKIFSQVRCILLLVDLITCVTY